MATYDNSTPAPPYGYPVAAGNRVDAHELIKIVRRRRMLIIGTVLGLSALATVVAYGLTPRYVGVASVMIDPQATRVVNTEGVLEEQAQDRFAIETEITMLRSRSFAQRLLERSDLFADPGVRQPARPGQSARSVRRRPLAGREPVAVALVAGRDRSGEAIHAGAAGNRRAEGIGRAIRDRRLPQQPERLAHRGFVRDSRSASPRPIR